MSEEKKTGIYVLIILYLLLLYLEITHWVAKMGEMSIFVTLKNEAFRQNVLLLA